MWSGEPGGIQRRIGEFENGMGSKGSVFEWVSLDGGEIPLDSDIGSTRLDSVS